MKSEKEEESIIIIQQKENISQEKYSVTIGTCNNNSHGPWGFVFDLFIFKEPIDPEQMYK